MSGYRKKMSGGYSGSGRRQPMSQRCAVRVTYTRNKNAGQWRAHGHYLARERATEKREKKAAGFSRSERSVDIAQRLDEWQKAGDDGSSKSSSRPSSETGSTLRITRG